MSDLSKLTVAKLKILCKEKGLKNYSKLSKPALLDKLGVAGSGRPPSDNIKEQGKPNLKAGPEKDTSRTNNLGSFIGSSTHSSTTTTLPGLGTEVVEQSRSEPQASTTEISTKSHTSLADSNPLLELPPEDNGLSSPARHASKRSNDIAFPLPVVSEQPRASKIPKNSHKPSLPKSFQVFKVPDFPRGQDDATGSLSSSNAMSICASNKPQPRSKTQYSTSLTAPGHTFNAATILPARPRIGLSSRIVSSLGKSGLPSTPSATISYDPPSRPQKKKFNTPRLIPKSLTERHIQKPSPPKRSPTLHFQTMEVLVLPLLKDIGIPPSMSQRKKLSMLSLALIYLDDAERASCVFVSRVFRYAVYVSAKDILNRWFAGGRLSQLIHGLSSRARSLDMTNLWPYLRLRQQEVAEQKDLYERGWVQRFFHELGAENTLPVSEELWASPDHEEQLSVALRFIQTRICLALSFHALEHAAMRWVTSTVIDAQQVLEKEIWCITVIGASSRKNNAIFNLKETFCVLYQTCEVIGHPPPTQTALPSYQDNSVITLGRSPQIPLRVDWSSYINLRLPIATRRVHPPLHEFIRWTSEDDFERGVARVWLSRIEGQGEEGKLKKQVAERYVLGCVAGNSVSGEYKSTTKMAMEFACVPEVPEAGLQRRPAAPRVSLYVPERHNIESVHLSSPRGPFHPDIALVQTAGRQEATFVLRENGVVIGEDERVPEIWMKLLRCSEKGMEL